MEIANCEHKEVAATDLSNGQVEASCAICGQRRRYIEGDDGSIVITKIGRRNGSIVMPPPGTRFEITSVETQLIQKGWDIINHREGNRLVKGAPVAAPEPVTKPEPEPEPVTKPEPVPEPQPIEQNELETYFDQHRDEILADRLSIGHGATLRKWKITAHDWLQLKSRWEGEGIEVQNLSKLRSENIRKSQQEAPATAEEKKDPPLPDDQLEGYEEPRSKAGEFCILITEEDLAKLDDDDYRLQWVLLGRIIRNRMS